MFPVLLLLFVVAPVVELYFIVQVSQALGAPETILLLAAISVLGAWLAKRQGLAVLRRMQGTVAQGKVPSREIIDGALVIFAAALMIAPGFLSDGLAILLLLSPTRAVVRSAILRRIRAGGLVTSVIRGSGRGAAPGGTWDADSWEAPPSAPGRPELEP